MEEKAFRPESCWFLFCYRKESHPEDKDVTEQGNAPEMEPMT